MTWDQLLKILLNMSKVEHTCMDKKVYLVVDGSIYEMDVFESVHTGDAYIGPAINTEEDDGEE